MRAGLDLGQVEHVGDQLVERLGGRAEVAEELVAPRVLGGIWRSSRATPSTPFSRGVISWLMVARKAPFGGCWRPGLVRWR